MTGAVRRLPRDPGPAGWNCLLPERKDWQRLEHVVSADFLVVGAGFAGLAAAKRLAELEPGAQIVLLDAKRVGDGPSGRNSGFMIDLPHDLSSDDYGGALDADLFQTRANRHGIAFAAQIAKDYGLSSEAFAQTGKINAAASQTGDAHNAEFAAHLQKMSEAHELLDAADMQKITGIPYYTSGLFTPGAAMIQPAMFVRGVAQGLVSNRVQLFENSPVLSLTRKTVWEARTPKGAVRAPKAILAVNGHLESFGFAKGRLMHVFTYASMTRALTPNEVSKLGGDQKWGVTPAHPMGTTVRRISGTGGDRIVIRNRFTFDPAMTVSDARISRVARDHDKAFAARFPMLDGVEMEYRWGGRLCLARNGVQMIGELEPGLYSACVQNGLGTAKGTLAGKLAAEIACGQQSEFTDHFIQEDLPTRLPPRPISTFGANAVIRWGELRAGPDL